MALVCPAAHYMMGGVKTDLWGRTSLPRLYDAGDTAATGVHGANRLASNSLLEGLVFGARAGQAMVKDVPVRKRSGAALPGNPAPLPENSSGAQKEPPKAASKPSPSCATLTQIREAMWRGGRVLLSGEEMG